MTAHDPKALPRLKIHYANDAGAHTLTVHYATGTDAALAVTNGQALCNQLKTLLHSSEAFSTAEFAPAGSNVFNPVTWTAIAGTTTVAKIGTDKANEISFVGRTVGGTRARLFLFSDVPVTDNNYRLTGAENTYVAGVVTWLNTNAATPVAADGLAAVWKNYMNIGRAKHWIRRLRG